MAKWTYHLADLITGAITAEIDLTQVKISQKLNAAGTMTGTWVVPSGWSGDDPYTLTMPARTMGVALRDGRPLFGGILWTRQPDDTEQSVALGFSDWLSFFDHRFVLPTFTPDGTTSQVSALSTLFAQVEQNDIARALLTQAQAHTGGNLGIVVDTTVSGILRDRTYAGHELVDVATALKQLAEVIDGPDFAFGVAPVLDTNGRVVKTLRLGNPRLGQSGSPHVLEWGANVTGLEWPSDGTKMVTRAYATGEGMDVGQLVAVAENSAAYSDGWPLLEQESSYNTVSTDETLQEHADADLYRNRLPVVVPSLTVLGSGLDSRGRKVYPAVGEVEVGDDVRVVIKNWFFRAGIDSRMRVVSLDYQPDGVETMTIAVNPILDDVA